MTQDWFLRLLSAGDHDVVTVRLRDAFGDDGVVGGCVVARDAGTWTVLLLMMSCRAMGRGVIDAVLTWLVRQAARAGARCVRIPCRPDSRNVPLRLALAAAGFRAAQADAGNGGSATGGREPGEGSGGQVPVMYQRDLDSALPSLPSWVTAPGEPGGGAP
jgi:predicted enzyme involved in methoxymalonyl-ACP biosynthesis